MCSDMVLTVTHTKLYNCNILCRTLLCFPCATDVECSDTVLPVTYTKFAGMMESGDTLYVGRYLVSGADSASLYLEVRQGLVSRDFTGFLISCCSSSSRGRSRQRQPLPGGGQGLSDCGLRRVL
jgi:aminopeptidase-like protein